MKRDLKLLGARVRNARLAKGLTLTELADRSGISKGYLSLLETGGDVNPTIDVLHNIAKALGFTLADVLNEPKVRSRGVVPVALPKGLVDLVDERKREGRPIDEDTVYWLANANYRGRQPKTKADYAYVLDSLERTTRRGQPDDE